MEALRSLRKILVVDTLHFKEMLNHSIELFSAKFGVIYLSKNKSRSDTDDGSFSIVLLNLGHDSVLLYI